MRVFCCWTEEDELAPTLLWGRVQFPTLGSGCGVLVAQSSPTVCDLMGCSPPVSSVQGIFQTRILERVAIPFSRGSSRPRDRTQVSCISGRFFTIWPTKGSPLGSGSWLCMIEKKKKTNPTYFHASSSLKTTRLLRKYLLVVAVTVKSPAFLNYWSVWPQSVSYLTLAGQKPGSFWSLLTCHCSAQRPA